MPSLIVIDPDKTYIHIPTDIKKPAEVASDGRGGVTLETFNSLAISQQVELEVRLTLAGVPETLWEHALLREAAEMMVAARILRRLRTFQEVGDSLFADANIKLRLFFSGVANVSEEGSGMELVVIEEEGVNKAQRPWLYDPNDLVDGFLTPRPKRTYGKPQN